MSYVKIMSDVAIKLAILKEKIKSLPNINDENYTSCRELINDCQEIMAKYCNCAPIKLISGKVEDIIENKKEENIEKSKDLFKILITKPSDYTSYGGEIKRWEDENQNYPDCSCGCKHFIPLEGSLGMDWGVCSNKNSERNGLLTWEHQNGYKCFEEEIEEDD